MATSKRRNARNKESISIADPPVVSNEEIIFQTWQNEVERDNQTLKKSLAVAKKDFLAEIDSLIKNTKPEILNMKMCDFRKLTLRQNEEAATTENKENEETISETTDIGSDEQVSRSHPDVLSNVESLMTQCIGPGGDKTLKVATVKRAASKRKKKVNPRAALKTPSHSMLSADWRSTPAFTPQLRPRKNTTTPLTAVRQAVPDDYKGLSFKFVAVNDRGSPVAPAEFQCPDLMRKLDRLAKDADKAFESARKK